MHVRHRTLTTILLLAALAVLAGCCGAPSPAKWWDPGTCGNCCPVGDPCDPCDPCGC